MSLQQALEIAVEEPLEPVYCGTCERLTVPTQSWHCQWCGISCKMAMEKRPCPHCQAPRLTQRVGYRYRHVICDCRDTPEQRFARAEALRKREVEENWERAKIRQRELDRIAAATALEKATKCYDDKRRECSVALTATKGPNKPKFDYCKACPKFCRPAAEVRKDLPASTYRPPLQPIPMEEI